MNKNRLFVVIAAIAVLALFVGGAFLRNRSETSAIAEAPGVDASILIRSHSQIYGNANASVTVVEFYDPECEACRAVHPFTKQIISDYGDRVRFVHRYMPFHGGSMLAASVLEEAKELGKYDQALDLLFERQPEWGDHHQPRPDLIAVILTEIGIPKERLETSYLLGKHQAKIAQDRDDGTAAGVRYTPTFFINGRPLIELGEAPLRKMIDEALAKRQP